ncbi:myrosinase 1-like [Battus philenor]|uniref:myrosinase 1-like n=1 Tax=Battus philenor TaxID=42288 RepID=UPI0035D0FCDE
MSCLIPLGGGKSYVEFLPTKTPLVIALCGMRRTTVSPGQGSPRGLSTRFAISDSLSRGMPVGFTPKDLVLVVGCNAFSPRQQRKFPDDFLFGTATASYQIEGGWNADDKGENIWDHMTHNYPDAIKDQTNGDVAADTYHNYKRDVEMMRELGLDAYRFSLSWARILPNGFANKRSEAGIAFYNNYINEMLKYGITPMVTIYHWDLPQKLQELGGFMSPLFPEWYEDYARVVFEEFGDRVKLWITFNEPREICYEGYDIDRKAPRVNATGIGVYICAKNLVMAHARAYHLYKNEFASSQDGVVGITISVNWFGPLTDSEEDELAAELTRQGQWGIYAEPIFSEEGGFPKELSERVAQKSREQGYPRSRMPEYTEEEKAFTRGAADFFGVNHYSGFLMTKGENLPEHTMADDIGSKSTTPEEWPVAASSWLNQSPDSIYNALNYLKNRYNNPVIYITENGWSTRPGAGLEDDDRIRYYRASLESALDALDAGINLKGYMAWSIMDNMEWMEGYTECFGLYEVDFEDPARTRTPRKSAFVYKQIIKTRVVDHEYEPDTRIMTIDEGH